MAKAEWGTKHQCQSCGTKFYDMRRSPIVCPSCGTEFDPEAHLRGKRGKGSGSTRAKAVEKEAPAAAAVEKQDEDLELESDLDLEVEDDTLEDASDLGEEDDLGKVGGDDEDDKS